MMKKIISLSLGSLIFFGVIFTAHARAPLSGNDIRRFIKVMKPLQKLGRKYNFKANRARPAENPNITNFFPMSRSLKAVEGHKGYDEFKAIIHNAGFSSPKKWASIGDRIMRAYVFRRLVRLLTPKRINHLRDNVAKIEKNKYLSLEIREKIRDNLKRTLAMPHEIPENIKADQESLKPFLAKLKRLFKEQQ